MKPRSCDDVDAALRRLDDKVANLERELKWTQEHVRRLMHGSFAALADASDEELAKHQEADAGFLGICCVECGRYSPCVFMVERRRRSGE